MQFRFTQYLVAMRSAQRFLDEHNAELGRVNLTGARRALDANIARIEALAQAQTLHRVGITNHLANEKRLLANFRRQEMKPIIDGARLHAGKVPGLDRLANTPTRGNTTQVVTAARSLATQAEEYQQLFIAMGFDDDFIPKFRAAADALVKAVADKGSARIGRKEATRQITEIIAETKQTLRVVNGLVEKTIADAKSPIRIAWQTAMALIARRSPATATEAATDAPATSSTSTPEVTTTKAA